MLGFDFDLKLCVKLVDVMVQLTDRVGRLTDATDQPTDAKIWQVDAILLAEEVFQSVGALVQPVEAMIPFKA